VQSANGLGLKAASGSDYCQTTISFPGDTIPKWVNSPNQSPTLCYEFKQNIACMVLKNMLIMTTYNPRKNSFLLFKILWIVIYIYFVIFGLKVVKQLLSLLTDGGFCIDREIPKLVNLKLYLLILIYVKLLLHGNR
jgi:hypothetical protein